MTEEPRDESFAPPDSPRESVTPPDPANVAEPSAAAHASEDAEQRLLAQLGARHALAGQIVHRLVEHGVRHIGRSAGMPLLHLPLLSLLGRALHVRTYARHEAADTWSKEVERFWWRRLSPQSMLFSRRRMAGPAWRRAQSSEIAQSAAGVDPASHDVEVDALAAAPGDLDVDALVAGPRAIEADALVSAAEEPAASWTAEVPRDLAPPPALAATRGWRAAMVAAWERLRGVSPPSPAVYDATNPPSPAIATPSPAIAAPSPPLDLPSPRMATPTPPTDTPPAPIATPEAPIATSSPPSIDAAPSPSVMGVAEASARTASHSGRGRREAPGEGAAATTPPGLLDEVADTRDPFELIAPLAQAIVSRPSILAASSTPSTTREAMAPSRLFWWPSRVTQSPRTATRAGHQQVVPSAAMPAASGATAAEPTPFEPEPAAAPADVPGAPGAEPPGLLGTLLHAHETAVAPLQRPLGMVHALQSAERWSARNTADLDRWRLLALTTSLGGAAEEPQATFAGAELTHEPAADQSPGAPRATTHEPSGDPPSSPSSPSGPSAPPPSASASPDVSPEIEVPGGASPVAATPPGASATWIEPRAVQPLDSSSTWWTPIPLIGGLVSALARPRALEGRPRPGEPSLESTQPAAQSMAVSAAAQAESEVPPPTPAALEPPPAGSSDAPAAPAASAPPGAPAEAIPPLADQSSWLQGLLRRGARIDQSRQPHVELIEAPGFEDRGATPRQAHLAAPREMLPDTPRAGRTRPAELTQPLPERPWESSDVELAEVISHLPPPMAAAAIAAGVLSDATPLPTSPTSPAEFAAAATQPGYTVTAPSFTLPPRPTRLDSAAAAPTIAPAAPIFGASLALGPPAPPATFGPTASVLVTAAANVAGQTPSPWTAVEATHLPAPAWSAAMGGARGAAPTAVASTTGTATTMAVGAANAGVSRAPIDRAVDAAAPAPAPVPAAGGASTGGAAGGAQPDLDHLTEEVFERLRWRLAIERDRYRE